MPIVNPSASPAIPGVTTLASVNLFSDVRALRAGQYPLVVVLGGTVVGDGQDGVFYWNSSSLTADDGLTVLAPNAGGTGRWIRLYSGFSLSSGASHVSTIQSGTGGLTSTVAAALQLLPHTSQYNTTTNFNTATAALTGTFGMHRLAFKTTNFPAATFTLKAFDGGSPNDTWQVGYNLSETLYTPNDLTEPQLWWGMESNYPNSAARDATYGTDPTCEMYWRYGRIGSSTTDYLEALFFNFDRTANKIVRGDFRAEHITLGNTNDGSNKSYVEITPTGHAVSNNVTITGLGTGLALTVNDADAIQLIHSTTGTNRARLRFTNTSGNLEIGLDNSNGNGLFSGGGGTAYSASIVAQTTQNINIGHDSPELVIVRVASSVNQLTVTAAATGNGPTLSATGTNSDIQLNLTSKGTSGIAMNTGGGAQVFIANTASANRFVQLTGSNGGNPTISVSAGRLNIGSALTLASLGAFASSDKYLIVDSSGNVHVSALGPAS